MRRYYSTRQEALHACTVDGKNLAFVDRHFTDDDEIVRTAMTHGGCIDRASFRLQNDPQMSLLYAKHTDFEPLFERALYCAKLDASLFSPYCGLFTKNREFILELKIHHGKGFLSPIRKYEFMGKDELQAELEQVRKEEIAYYRQAFRSNKSISYIQEEVSLSDDLNFALIRIPAIGLRSRGKPFSDVKDSIKSMLESFENEKHIYCAKPESGSFPERVMSAVLGQLHIDYAREKVFPWSSGGNANGRLGEKRYDFFLPAENAIIEVHGAQHYNGGFEAFGGRSSIEEQENDRLKATLAKENNISYYIVINAISSDFHYIEQSVATNETMNQLFDLRSVDWNDVRKRAIGEEFGNISFPFFIEREKYYRAWLSLIEKTETETDYLPPPPVIENAVESESSDGQPDLLALKRNAFISNRGLYPNELAVLAAAPKYQYPLDHAAVSEFLKHLLGGEDVAICFDKLVAGGFLCVGDVWNTVERATVPEIKRFLSLHGLSAQGRKADLVARVYENFFAADVEKEFPAQYYALTEMGERELSENPYITEKHTCGLSIWTLNKVMHTYPGTDIHRLLIDYCDDPSVLYPLLNDDEKWGIGYCCERDRSFNVSSCVDRGLIYSSALIYKNDGNNRKAYEQFLRIMALDLMLDPSIYAEYDFDKFMSDCFPYSTSIVKVAPGIVAEANIVRKKLTPTKAQEKALIATVVSNAQTPSIVFTKAEISVILMAELDHDTATVMRVYREAKKRLCANPASISRKEDYKATKKETVTRPGSKLSKFIRSVFH